MDKAKLLWQERRSESPFIESVWSCYAPIATPRTVIADPCLSLAFVKDDSGPRIILGGPRAKPYKTILPMGFISTTIRLKPGVSIKGYSAQTLANHPAILPADEKGRFELAGNVFQFPDFNHAEQFLDELSKTQCLVYDIAGKSSIQSDGHQSSRTYSRHIQRSTGLSPYKLYQLQRMHQALRLLKQGVPAIDVASELSFTDQAHLIHASKKFFGYTPKRLAELPQTP